MLGDLLNVLSCMQALHQNPILPPTTAMDSQTASSMSDFSENDRKELQQFIENENQKAKFQTSTSPFPSFLHFPSVVTK